MTLALDNAFSQLLAWGVLDEAALVQDDVVVSSVARRNLNLRLERRQGPGLLIKQPDPTAAASRRTLRAEGRFYEFCDEEPLASPVALRMPRLHASFPEEAVLVIGLAEESRSLWEDLRTQGTWEAFEALGKALGTLHATFRRPGLANDPRLSDLWDEAPSFFSVHRPRPGALRRLGSAEQQMLRLVQAEPAICDGLDAARAAWKVETVIHGDVRPANVLVVPAGGVVDILLVDWEMVRHGDPAYDVGAALASFALFWVLGLPLESDLEAAPRVAAAAYPLATLHPALGAFWRAYVTAAGLAGPAADGLLGSAVVYSAAVLVMSAWEYSHDRRRLTSLAVLLLQLAANVFADPDQQARKLYGLESSP